MRAPHARNDRGDSCGSQAEAQGEGGKLVERDAGVADDALNGIPDLLLAVATKVIVAEVAFGECRVGRELSGECAFIEGDADDYADSVLLAVGEEFVFGRLVEDVVDNLHAIDQTSVE